jgi:hypothetical protein
MTTRSLLLTSVGLAWSLPANADPLDCADMAFAVREMLVERMRIPQCLGLDITEAADAAFGMNCFRTERRECKRTFCSAMIRFTQTRAAGRRGTAMAPFRGGWLARS